MQTTIKKRYRVIDQRIREELFKFLLALPKENTTIRNQDAGIDKGIRSVIYRGFLI